MCLHSSLSDIFLKEPQIKQFIIIKLQKEGIHRWKDCPYDEVSFLKDWHRHVFHVEVKMSVTHEDREVEFILVKGRLNDFLSGLFKDKMELSCEAISMKIFEFLSGLYGVYRNYSIYVFEDGENGGGIEV